MKWDTALLILAGVALVAVAIFTPAYATNTNGNTYNQGNNVDVQFITVKVDDSQYTNAFNNTVEYKERVVIGSGGRNVTYDYVSTGTVIYEEEAVDICELGVLNLTVESSEALDSYTIQMKGVTGTMTGTFYLRYWLSPAQNLDTGTAPPDGVCEFDTETGCSFPVNPSASKVLVSLCVKAETVTSTIPVLNNVSFMISVVANGGSP